MTPIGGRFDALANEDGVVGGRITARKWVSWRVQLGTDDEGQPALVEIWEGQPSECWEREGMFEAFLRLADSDDAAILRFANRYGILGLCRHGVPGVTTCKRLSAGHVKAERLKHWRAWSRRLAGAIEVGQQIVAGLPPSPDAVDRMLSGRAVGPDPSAVTFSGLSRHLDVSAVSDWLKGAYRVERSKLPGMQAWYFCRFLNEWLSARAVLMPAQEKGRKLRVEYGPTGLFAALMMNVALAVTEVKSFAVCSNCGEPFSIKRRRAPGRRAYCPRPDCRYRAARRDASRTYRAKNK